MKRIGSDLKKAAASALALTLMTSAVSCSIFPANESSSESTKDTTEETSEETSEETTSVPAEESEVTEANDLNSATRGYITGFDPSEPWCQAYLDQIPLILFDFVAPEALTYTLIYLDDDDIPEVFIEGDCEATGEIILSYHDGEVSYVWLSRLGTQYIPRSGLTFTNTGHMDYYPVTITSLSDGEFSTLAEGIWYLSEEGRDQRAENPEGDWDYTYEWEGQEVTEEEFSQSISEYYDMEQGVYPDCFYTYDEFVTLMTTGTWESSGHRYELIVNDCTWEEANQDCIDRGGYLAVISCTPEAQVIADLIEDEGLEDYYFYSGYRASAYIGDEFYVAGFYYPDMSSPTSSYYYFAYDFSDYRSPDFDWTNAPFHYDAHECGILVYYPEENFFYIFEGPFDLTGEYSGSIAYVCEYDA